MRLLFLPLLWLICSCASAPPKPGEPGGRPLWTLQPSRTMEGGYIIFVGNAEDVAPERAHFKATGSAIQDIANECSFAPKGTRTEDGFDEKQGSEAGGRYRSWIKISIQYEDCEAAKKAVDPGSIRKLANAQLASELKRYQDLIDEPQPEALVATSAEAPAGTPGSPSAPQAVEIRDSGSFFWARQQVAYTKQIVILAPAGTYPAGSPQSARFASQMAPAQGSLQRYEAQNPQIKTWNQSYSASPRHIQKNPLHHAPQLRLGSPKGNHLSGGGGKRRRRWVR